MADAGLPPVTVSVSGRFHAFDLARQLHRRGALHRLLTSYPKFKTRHWGIPDDKVTSALSHEILNRLSSKINLPPNLRREFQLQMVRRWGRLSAKLLPNDVRLFVGWSGMSIEPIRKARRLGAKTIVERGSTHILFQNRILAEAYAGAGLEWPGIHPEGIQRELEEYAEADNIFVPTAFVRDTFVQNGVPVEKIIVVPYGCDLASFQRQPKLDNVFRIIHCGQISIQKGAHLLIQAFNELKLKNAELWLIGGLNPELAALLDRTANPAIQVKGPFPQAQLAQYYSQGSVFCIASWQEGLAMVIPQALSCGLPVVATYNSGAPEVVDDGRTGFLIPAGDVSAIKEKLLQLYQDPDLLAWLAGNVAGGGLIDLSWDRYGRSIDLEYRRIMRA